MDIARLYKPVCLARVLRDLDLKVITLAKPRSNCRSKLQTPPLVGQGTRQEISNCQTEKKSGYGFQMGARHQDKLADRLPVVT
jgi:hypothetical protein